MAPRHSYVDPVPLLEDLLLRFRRVWAPPGPAAGQAGVPEDAAAHRGDELHEVFEALQAIEDEGREVIRIAEAEAASVGEAARAECGQILEAARTRAPQVRAARAALRVREREADIDQLIAAAEQQARAIRERARARAQPIVDQVVADVFAATTSLEEGHARVVGGG